MSRFLDDPAKSYRTLRRLVGILGVGLPLVLAICGLFLTAPPSLQPSISDYYWLRTRDVLVGTLFAVGWFLFCYHGYEPRDDWAAKFAGVFALGVALFPATPSGFEHYAHLTCAASLFTILAYFCLVLFTKSGTHKTLRKVWRNRLYTACGVVILLCILLIAVFYLFLGDSPLATLKPVFWLESLALWAFGLSWFVKGDTLFKDRPGDPLYAA